MATVKKRKKTQKVTSDLLKLTKTVGIDAHSFKLVLGLFKYLKVSG